MDNDGCTPCIGERKTPLEEIGWDDFLAFRESFAAFKPLPGIAGGVHHFVVCVCGEGQTYNIIPHKYLIEPTGRSVATISTDGIEKSAKILTGS